MPIAATLPSLDRAYRAMVLLTGDIRQAERALECAIDGLEDPSDDTLLVRAVEAALSMGSPAIQNIEELARTASRLPIELRRVLALPLPLRQAYVLCILMGLPRAQCARLLHVGLDELEERIRGAARVLADLYTLWLTLSR